MFRNRSKFVLMIIFLMLTLTACGPPNPQTTITDYWQAVSSGNQTEATTYLSQHTDSNRWLENFWPENSEEFVDDEKTALFLQRVTLTPTGHEINGEEAVVDVTVTWPHLGTFFTTLMTEALSEVFSLAMNGASQAEIDAEVETIFISVLAKTPDTSTQHTVDLVLEDGKWKIATAVLPDPAKLFNLE